MAKQKTLKDIYKQMGLSDSQVSSKGTVKKDVWKEDLLKPLSIKKYGRSYDDKLKSMFGDEWRAKDFERFMDYQSARDTISQNRANLATSTWEKDHEKSLKVQREKEAKALEEEKKKAAAKKKKAEVAKSLVPSKKKDETTLWDDIKATGKTAAQIVNPFDKVNMEDAVKNYMNRNTSKTFDEVARGSNRAVDSASLGVMSNLDKKVNKRDPYYLSERKFGEGGGTDMLTTGLGYLTPGIGAYQALNAAKAGKALTQFGSKGLTQRLASEAAKGAVIGAGMSGAEIGVREGLNPQDQDWKDNLSYFGMNTALGAVADPLMYGAGKAIGKGYEKGLQKLIKGDLPKFDGNVPTETIDNLMPNPKSLPKLVQEPLTMDSAFNVKRAHNPSQPLNEFLGRPQQAESPLMQMAKKNMYTPRPMADMASAKPVIESGDNIISRHFGVETPKTDLVETAPPEYWQNRYEEFVNHVNKNYDTNKLTQEGLEDLWSQFAKYEEPVTLEQVVDLAYNGYKPSKPLNAADVWEQLGNRPSVSQNAKKIMGIEGGPVKPKAPKPEVLPELTIKRTIYKPSKPVQEVANTNTPQPPVSQLGTPVNAPKQPNERSFYSTVQNPEKLTPELQQRLNEFDKTYKPMSNQELVDFANKYVSKDIEQAYQFVKNARKFDPRHVTVGHRLIDELQKAGQFDRALDVVERLAEQGTKAGQSIQSFSIYNRLSAEGQLLRAQRHVNKINQGVTDPNKQVKLTPQNVEDITHTADSIQKFAGNVEQANNVMKVMESVKKGKIATDSELEMVRSFVADAKKFFGDLDPAATPKAPRPVKDARTRDKVVDFMSKREDVARKELQKIFGRANSMPVDAFYHLSVIGASKIAKGSVKLADFTEEMVKEFGDQVRPYAKQIYNKAVETFNLQSESMTRQRLSEVEKITNKALKDKNLSVDEAEEIREFARRVGAMSGEAKLESSMELQTILQTLDRPTFGQKLSTAQTIAQLLNPKTIVRNAIGNEMFYRVEQLNKLLATPVDIVRSKITGGERTITFVANNQGQYWQNWLTGARAGWKGVNPMGLQTAYDLGPQAFRSKWNPLTYLEKTLGATLRSFDHAGYMRAYNKTIGEIATLRAVNEGLKGEAKKEAIKRYIREADENMIQLADQYGKYSTFQDNTVISAGLQKLKRGLNFNQDFGLGDLILKYPKTPGNLVMRALEYSPAGALRSFHLLSQLRKGNNPLITKEATMAFSRAIIGTAGFSVLGYALADMGVLTSRGNSDYEIAQLEKIAGKQPNSVNVSALSRFIQSGFKLDSAKTKKGDTFVSYDWAQPISIAMALGTGVNQSEKESGELNTFDAAKGALDSGFNTIIQSSVLKGVNDFLANYPGRTMSDRIGDATKGALGSFVPTLSNQIRQTNSNDARTTYSPSFTEEALNRAKNRIPGLDQQLPPSYDSLGNKRETYQDGSNNLLNVFLNPSFVSKYNPSEEAQFLLDYINETGDKRVAPRLVDKKIDGTPLSGEQYAELQRLVGTETQKGLKNLLPELKQNNNSAEVGKEIYNLLNAAGKKGKSAIRNQVVTKEQLATAKKNYGLDEETIKDRIKKGWTLTRALTTPNE